MLTREQWQDAARFAGLRSPEWMEPDDDETPSLIHQVEMRPDVFRWGRWRADSDWSDFGPLWVKLHRWWLTEMTGKQQPFETQIDALGKAILHGTDHELMHAGLLLAAAIGADMDTQG